MFKDPLKLKDNDVTSEENYNNRREFMKSASKTFIGASIVSGAAMGSGILGAKAAPAQTDYSALDDKKTSYKDITGYTNFYEFSLNKREPTKLAQQLKTDPWTIEVGGECNNGGKFDFDTFTKMADKEERIYRFRCVEAWSMIIPWNGLSLATLLKQFDPNSKAKYVKFTTLHDEDQMPLQRTKALTWPYVEGLRLDEAMNPLAFIATGLYGKDLPKQNGAPLRLIVPWKYGFKNIKSIVKIEFTQMQPINTWNISAPDEYGFYANVNPKVPHARWSQATERVIGASLFSNMRKTDPFNSYESEVADLYKGMDLKVHF